MVTDPVSGIRHEVQQLIQQQIDTLRLESSLTSAQLWEYHSRSKRITLAFEGVKPPSCEECHGSRSQAIAALAEEAKDDYLLTNPAIRNAKAVVRSTTRQR